MLGLPLCVGRLAACPGGGWAKRLAGLPKMAAHPNTPSMAGPASLSHRTRPARAVLDGGSWPPLSVDLPPRCATPDDAEHVLRVGRSGSHCVSGGANGPCAHRGGRNWKSPCPGLEFVEVVAAWSVCDAGGHARNNPHRHVARSGQKSGSSTHGRPWAMTRWRARTRELLSAKIRIFLSAASGRANSKWR